MPRKSNSRLEQLRSEVRNAHRLATRKVLRNEAKGIQLQGSSYDPRRDINKVGRYNAAQLNSYLKTLTSFRSRKNQFVKGAKGAPLPASQWREYAKIQKRINSASAKVDASYADIFIDNSGMTVGQRLQHLTPDDNIGKNPSVNAIFTRKLKRAPENVTNSKALQDLIRKEQRKLDPKYIDSIVSRGRKTVNTFMMTSGRYDLIKDLNKLTTKQFHLLWQYTYLGDVSSLAYQLAKSRLMPEKSARGNRWEQGVIDDSFEDVEKLVKWAGTVK